MKSMSLLDLVESIMLQGSSFPVCSHKSVWINSHSFINSWINDIVKTNISKGLFDVNMLIWCEYAYLIWICLFDMNMLIWCEYAYLIWICLFDMNMLIWYEYAYLIWICLFDVRS